MANPTVTIGGTAEAMLHPGRSLGGTVLELEDNNDLVANAQLQGGTATNPVQNPFQTVNLFVGEFSRVYALAPLAAIMRIKDILDAMRLQSYQ